MNPENQPRLRRPRSTTLLFAALLAGTFVWLQLRFSSVYGWPFAFFSTFPGYVSDITFGHTINLKSNQVNWEGVCLDGAFALIVLGISTALCEYFSRTRETYIRKNPNAVRFNVASIASVILVAAVILLLNTSASFDEDLLKQPGHICRFHHFGWPVPDMCYYWDLLNLDRIFVTSSLLFWNVWRAIANLALGLALICGFGLLALKLSKKQQST